MEKRLRLHTIADDYGDQYLHGWKARHAVSQRGCLFTDAALW
jgi:hypothetical protein